jgi:hypothetical protein
MLQGRKSGRLVHSSRRSVAATKITVSFQHGRSEMRSTVKPSAASLSWTKRLSDQGGSAGLMSKAPPPWSFGK